MVPQTVPGGRNLLKPKAVGSTVPGKPGKRGFDELFAGRMCAGGTTFRVKTPDST